MKKPKQKSQKKAAEVISLIDAIVSDMFRPRGWQKDASDQCHVIAKSGSDRALIYACPGSGKTFGGLYIAKNLRDLDFKGAHIIVVTPNLAIKTQWIDRAKTVGLELLPVKSRADLFQETFCLGNTGYILNYQQAVILSDDLRKFCENKPVIVILDEVHHTEGPRDGSGGNEWGRAVEHAFSMAKFKLCTTGTPFRKGDYPIVFVEYNDNRDVVPNVSYTYQQAIKDDICRPIEFVLFDGEITWRQHDGAPQQTAAFGDKVSKKISAQRLRAAIAENTDFLRSMLEAANTRLEEIRAGDGVDAAAAGLVVACDTAHAEEIANMLAGISGEQPLVVHSKIDEAQRRIDMFRDGKSKWIIGVDMLSEGVDIPRLRVGVYASNIRASLYFHQFCGRMMRVQESARERSFVFMPADKVLEDIALTIEEARCHALGEEFHKNLPRSTGALGKKIRTGIIVENSNGEEKAFVLSGYKFPHEYIKQHLARICKFRLSIPERARDTNSEILRLMIGCGAITPPNDEEAA